MLSKVEAHRVTVRGLSLGGVYTTVFVPELSALFDVGIPSRSFAAADHYFLSHGHMDHVGALGSVLGIRALVGKARPPRVYMPAEVCEPLLDALRALSKLQDYDLAIDPVPLRPGDRETVSGDLQVKAFRTHHRVPSLGFTLERAINKLKPEYRGLPGQKIGELRRAKADIFDVVCRRELSYCTDSLVQALDHEPELYESRNLILECTFLDERKTLAASRAGCHIHLDEILERAHLFKNEALVLMHFSQLYKPREVLEILERRCPPELFKKVRALVPRGNHWPG